MDKPPPSHSSLQWASSPRSPRAPHFFGGLRPTHWANSPHSFVQWYLSV